MYYFWVFWSLFYIGYGVYSTLRCWSFFCMKI